MKPAEPLNKKIILALSAMSVLVFAWYFNEITLASLAYNDAVNHLAIIRGIDETWKNGGNIFDFWMGHSGLGHPLVRNYQFLMHLVFWILHKTLFAGLTLERAFNTSVALCAMALPWAVFRGATLWGLNSLQAVCAAASVLLISEAGGYGLGLTNFSFSGYGTYNQLFATLFFCFAIGHGRHALESRKHAVLTGLFFSITLLSHILTGYFAFLWISIDIALDIARRIKHRLHFRKSDFINIAWLIGTALLTSAHWVLPMAIDGPQQHHSPIEPTTKWTGIGAQAMIDTIIQGNLLDGARFPTISLLAAIGFFFALTRALRSRSEQHSVLHRLTLQTILWTALSFGPYTWGALFWILPFANHLHWHRFFAVTEFCLCLCAGVTLAWFIKNAVKKIPFAAVCVSLAVLSISPLIERGTYFWINNPRWLTDTRDKWNDLSNEYKAGVTFAVNNQDARIAPGSHYDWGKTLLVTSFIPYYGVLNQLNIANTGSIYHYQNFSSLLQFKANYKDEFDLQLMNAKYLVIPPNDLAPQNFIEQERGKNHVIYANQKNEGYFTQGQIVPGGCTDNLNFPTALERWLRNGLAKAKIFPAIRFSKQCFENELLANLNYAEKKIEPVATPYTENKNATIRSGASSKVFESDIYVQKNNSIIFKMNYHMNWKAYLDGNQVETFATLPSYIAIDAAPGLHHVRFEYVSDLLKTALLWICGATLIGIASLLWIDKKRT